MEGILEVIKNITVFVLVYSLVTNLFSSSKYYRYFKFVGGILVIILVITPLISRVTGEEFLNELLEKNVTRSEQNFCEDELRMIGEQREQMLREEWEKGETNNE